jgi:ferredoxin-NADP reductase
VYEFRLQKPAGFTFKPGQFVLFKIPLIENPADIQTRAFSIASAPFEDDLLFVAKMIPGGRASRWIEERLDVGSTIDFQGPFGNFVLNRTTEKEYMFLATSTGIAPFRSMVLSALAENDARRMDVVLCVKTEADLFWADELAAIGKDRSNVFIHVSVTAPTGSWNGHKQRIQVIAPGIAKNDFSNKNVYVCGSPAMTADVKKTALEQWGIDKKDLHVEGYI